MIIYEPFTGHFTGGLSTIVAQNHARYVFKLPIPRIQKGAPYMLKLDSEKHTAQLIPVILPHPDERG